MNGKGIIRKIQKNTPDKLIIKGFQTLSSLAPKGYSKKKAEAKGKAKLTYIGEENPDAVQNQLFVFNNTDYSESKELASFDDLKAIPADKVGWLNFHGIHDIPLLESLGKVLALDRLSIRQLIDTTLRPKVEDYEHYLFFSVKSILENEKDEGGLNVEQISFVLTQNLVVSFQEKVADHFDHIRAKIKDNMGLIRKKESEYLLVQLLDAILDNYFETIEAVNQRLVWIEQEVLSEPKNKNLLELEKERREIQIIKKSLFPFSEALTNILNGKTKFVADHNLKYFRDLQNNAANALEEVESSNKSIESLTNIYFSSLSQKMNETMKVLTTVATIFIPLTFLAGIYGMNFEYMPELGYRYSYFILLAIMGVTVGAMIYYFKKKNWL